ncbi:MAG: YIEGIA domain-containing protein, partial [Peptostreptococcaceae bacterium]
SYESRSYISLVTSLVASICFIRSYKVHNLGYFGATIVAIIGGVIVGLIFKRILRRDSIGDYAKVEVADITFDDEILKVNNVYIDNIGLKDSRKKYLENGIGLLITPNNFKSFGVVADEFQRQAILHNIFINFGINKDVDEKDLLAISRVDLKNKQIVIPYLPLRKDVDEILRAVNSTPVIEYAKRNLSAYKN